MNNDAFDDIGVLTILQQLVNADMLHPDDRNALLIRVKSSFGRRVAHNIVNSLPINEDDRSILRRFSTGFD